MSEEEVRRIGRHSAYLLVGKVLIAILSFAVTYLLTQRLEPKDYGVFSYALSAATFLVPFASLGLLTYLSREVSFGLGTKDRGMIKGAIEKAGKLILMLSVTITLVLIFAAEYLPYTKYVRLMAPYLVLIIMLSSATTVLTNLRRIGISTLVNLSAKALAVVFLYLLTTEFLVGSIISFQAALILPLLGAGLFIYKKVFHGVKAKVIELREAFNFSIPYYIGESVSNMNMYLGIFVLTFLAFKFGIEEVGYYSLAFGITTFFMNFLVFVPAAVNPAIMQFYGEKKFKRAESAFQTSFKYTFLFVFPIIFGLVASADVIILQIFKEPYIQAAPVLQILALGIIPSILFRCVVPIVWYKKKTKDYMKYLIASFFILGILMAGLAPVMGAEGAAIARVVSSLIVMTLLTRKLLRIAGVKLKKRVIATEFLAALIFLSLMFLPRNLLILVPVAVVLFGLYLLILYSVGVLTKHDLDKVRLVIPI